ncbi:hypothetical protein B0T26DRAFT_95639 [Lasiosphaeria miniovina]|uniref:DUF7689 domain-containing protein n=1 Tax=Lasiosphaeria miniovina TaxID=1954250 RepID=A0AA40EF01_9PEZI|nr:uncharacterized protein B0T26DRAFT_95639 [Lasiosphaeria miniovina]KAK0735081.1 hypothetical protein B0T26DRAFT_95639 [Lasiosphaeria miniovina]
MANPAPQNIAQLQAPARTELQAWLAARFSTIATHVAAGSAINLLYTIVPPPANATLTAYNCLAHAVGVTDEVFNFQTWEDIDQRYANMGYLIPSPAKLLATPTADGDVEVYSKPQWGPLHAHRVVTANVANINNSVCHSKMGADRTLQHNRSLLDCARPGQAAGTMPYFGRIVSLYRYDDDNEKEGKFPTPNNYPFFYLTFNIYNYPTHPSNPVITKVSRTRVKRKDAVFTRSGNPVLHKQAERTESRRAHRKKPYAGPADKSETTATAANGHANGHGNVLQPRDVNKQTLPALTRK